jgi:hypothetical protein
MFSRSFSLTCLLVAVSFAQTVRTACTIGLQQYFDGYLKGAPEPDGMTRGVPPQMLQGGGQR